MSKSEIEGSATGNKSPMSPGSPTASTTNSADRTGAKNLYIISVKGMKGRLNKVPLASGDGIVMATVKKEKPNLWQKVLPAIFVGQRESWGSKNDDVHTYFEYNAGAIAKKLKGEMKGSAITGPIGKECSIKALPPRNVTPLTE
ncbi:hypothetical protein V6N13_009037 [Hibiscus sabdariffa]|uniref:Uncharacterized protein n=1 Tax=Hibiscus sabdariffa TaxID=183260 RepID=A0ABR2ADX6_9ROSI